MSFFNYKTPGMGYDVKVWPEPHGRGQILTSLDLPPRPLHDHFRASQPQSLKGPESPGLVYGHTTLNAPDLV